MFRLAPTSHHSPARTPYFMARSAPGSTTRSATCREHARGRIATSSSPGHDPQSLATAPRATIRLYRHLLLLAFGFCACLGPAPARGEDSTRPNILWITSEDNGPHLGAYGDTYADTPNLDGLAARGLTYLNALSTAPVCAPARTAIISGMYPPSTGAEHMRSMTSLPPGMKMYPQYLREAGYYCTNNSKEDYNLEKPGKVWDESSRNAHWKNRPAGQPFFAIFNHTVSHESQIRKRPHRAIHDPAKVRVPAYHPDTPEVRQDWAQYYDKVTEMDERAGRNLRELEEAGLADETIVFYYGDHGPGMPRSKRWPYNSGLNVPLIVHIPEKFRDLAPAEYSPGARTDRLVGFVDLAPTVLSLVGIRPPEHMQGHAFLGKFEAPEQPYAFGFRGRMDERYDMVRVARDKRYIYIRNYMPHRIYGQHVAYMFQTPTTQVWKRLFDQGKLEPPRTLFWETKPPEELYDLRADPDEVKNLANSPDHQAILTELRLAQQGLALAIRDVGFLPEDEIHRRSSGSTPYEMGHDPALYPLEAILAAAELAASLRPEVVPALLRLLSSDDSAVRYWAVMGLLMRGRDVVRESATALSRALDDVSPVVRVVAAEALGHHGDGTEREKVLAVLLDAANVNHHGAYVANLALNVIDQLDEVAAPILEDVKALPRSDPSVPARARSYVGRLIQKILQDASEEE